VPNAASGPWHRDSIPHTQTMNATRLEYYNDDLMGDFLACMPGHVADDLELLCMVGMPMLGWLYFVNGLGFFYHCLVQRSMMKPQVKVTQVAPSSSFVERLPGRPIRVCRTFDYRQKLLISLSVGHFGVSLMFVVHAFGTSYPSTHIRGQIGDFTGKSLV
jgi:hypothetical protein